MHHLRLAAAVLLALLAALVPVASASAQAPACPDARLVPAAGNAAVIVRLDAATVCLVNRQRAAIGLPALKPEPRLAFAALGFASQMVRQGFFNHVAPDGATFVDRVRPTGYISGVRGYRLAETIAWGTGAKGTPAGTVAQWMASPPHRAALMDPKLEDIGVGMTPGAPVAGLNNPTAGTYVAELGRRR
jgi:uncharacterized protein YkwD